jgi:hypothetical protein
VAAVQAGCHTPEDGRDQAARPRIIKAWIARKDKAAVEICRGLVVFQNLF